MTDPVSALLVVFAVMAGVAVALFVSTGVLARRHRAQREMLANELGRALWQGLTGEGHEPQRKLFRKRVRNLTTGDLIMAPELVAQIQQLDRISERPPPPGPSDSDSSGPAG